MRPMAVLLRSGVLGTSVVLTVTACGAPVTSQPLKHRSPPVSAQSGGCSGFELSLVSNSGGRASPVMAAEWTATHLNGVPALPHSGWALASRSGSSATVVSGNVTLHAVQGPDGTWQVDSGSVC